MAAWGRSRPDRPSEIDLVRTRERTSCGTYRAADQRAFKGGAHEADAGADAAAAHGTITRAMAAGAECQKQDDGKQRCQISSKNYTEMILLWNQMAGRCGWG